MAATTSWHFCGRFCIGLLTSVAAEPLSTSCLHWHSQALPAESEETTQRSQTHTVQQYQQALAEHGSQRMSVMMMFASRSVCLSSWLAKEFVY